jgi:hypothetical protein
MDAEGTGIIIWSIYVEGLTKSITLELSTSFPIVSGTRNLGKQKTSLVVLSIPKMVLSPLYAMNSKSSKPIVNYVYRENIDKANIVLRMYRTFVSKCYITYKVLYTDSIKNLTTPPPPTGSFSPNPIYRRNISSRIVEVNLQSLYIKYQALIEPV